MIYYDSCMIIDEDGEIMVYDYDPRSNIHVADAVRRYGDGGRECMIIRSANESVARRSCIWMHKAFGQLDSITVIFVYRGIRLLAMPLGCSNCDPVTLLDQLQSEGWVRKDIARRLNRAFNNHGRPYCEDEDWRPCEQICPFEEMLDAFVCGLPKMLRMHFGICGHHCML
jgi:hypothetical protein